jgi:hypothetical protein
LFPSEIKIMGRNAEDDDGMEKVKREGVERQLKKNWKAQVFNNRHLIT